ncbi:MAG: GTP cyclohydrolase I [Deltaproteobacteria bacterium]|nr:GTP cyclohydrolase I [Deltaproteobacteria bacterium]
MGPKHPPTATWTPEAHMAEVLVALGFDTDPEAARSAAGFVDFLSGLAPGRAAPELEILTTQSTDPVVLREIPFQSLCAHHLVPFHGTATIAVRPAGRIAGLGGMVRLLHHHALRTQIQERLGATLASDLRLRLGAACVGVRLVARHLCLEMRGARTRAEVETVAWAGEADELLQRLLLPG